VASQEQLLKKSISWDGKKDEQEKPLMKRDVTQQTNRATTRPKTVVPILIGEPAPLFIRGEKHIKETASG